MTYKEKLEKLNQIKQKHLGYEFPTHEDYKSDVDWLIKEIESLNHHKDVYKQITREQGEENDKLRERLRKEIAEKEQHHEQVLIEEKKVNKLEIEIESLKKYSLGVNVHNDYLELVTEFDKICENAQRYEQALKDIEEVYIKAQPDVHGDVEYDSDDVMDMMYNVTQKALKI